MVSVVSKLRWCKHFSLMSNVSGFDKLGVDFFCCGTEFLADPGHDTLAISLSCIRIISLLAPLANLLKRCVFHLMSACFHFL